MIESKNAIDFAIMVEPGKLEWQFIVCVASLLSHCYDDYKIHAFCRADRINKLNPALVAFCQGFDIAINPITNPFPDGYPEGNKMVAAGQFSGSRRVVFLDTDTGMMRPAHFTRAMGSGSVGFVPARKKTWTVELEDWRRLYAHFGMELPRHRVQLAFDGTWVPYGNAGVVMFDDSQFGRDWLNIALEIDKLKGFPNFRPWLDQVALPIAIYAHKHRFEPLEMIWNDTPLLYSKSSIMMHYHKVEWMAQYKINLVLRETLAAQTQYGSIGELLTVLPA